MIRTTHIREMLSQAIDACEKAEEISKKAGTGSITLEDHEQIQRLLRGAAVNAMHSHAEIQDEIFREAHGDDGFTR